MSGNCNQPYRCVKCNENHGPTVCKLKNTDTQFYNLKHLLSETKKQLQIEFQNSINSYWENKIKNVPLHESSETFPRINNIFRKKNHLTIPEIINIPKDKREILIKANLNPDNVNKDTIGNFLISDNEEKLNTLESHFSLIHLQNEQMGKDHIYVQTHK